MQDDLTGPGATLAQEQQLAQALLLLLRHEQQGLIDADTDVVMSLLAEKSRLVASLRSLAAAREQALLNAGHPVSEKGMQAWLLGTKASAGLRLNWSTLMETSRTAREMNRINGLLIHRHMLRNQAALEVLQGRPAHSNVYGPNGQTTQRQQSRSRVIG